MTTDALGATPSTQVTQAPDHARAEGIPAAWATAKRLYQFLLPLRFSFLALFVVGFAFIISDPDS